MSGYSGVRRKERQKLNRHKTYRGGALEFSWKANDALERVIRHVRGDLKKLDKRTNPNQNLVAAVKRLELLKREISR